MSSNGWDSQNSGSPSLLRAQAAKMRAAIAIGVFDGIPRPAAEAAIESVCHQQYPSGRCQAIGIFEVPAHMALVSESGVRGGLRERRSIPDQTADLIKLAASPEACRARPKHRAELARECPAIEARYAFKLAHREP